MSVSLVLSKLIAFFWPPMVSFMKRPEIRYIGVPVYNAWPTRAEREHFHGVRIFNPTLGRPGFRRQRKVLYPYCYAEGMWRSQEASLSVGGRAQPLSHNVEFERSTRWVSALALAWPFGHLRLCLKLRVQAFWVQGFGPDLKNHFVDPGLEMHDIS